VAVVDQDQMWLLETVVLAVVALLIKPLVLEFQDKVLMAAHTLMAVVVAVVQPQQE
jgi:hypothetical protein